MSQLPFRLVVRMPVAAGFLSTMTHPCPSSMDFKRKKTHKNMGSPQNSMPYSSDLVWILKGNPHVKKNTIAPPQKKKSAPDTDMSIQSGRPWKGGEPYQTIVAGVFRQGPIRIFKILISPVPADPITTEPGLWWWGACPHNMGKRCYANARQPHVEKK